MEFWQKILGNLNKKIIIWGILGVILILVGNWQSSFISNKEPKGVEKQKAERESADIRMGNESEEIRLETELEDILSQIEGVGQIKVRVFLESGKQYQYAYNKNVEKRITEEKDQQGGARITTETKDGEEMIVVRDSQTGSEKPVVLKELRPPVKGVIVVAQGAEDSLVKANLQNAVQTILEIPAFKVTVLPRKDG